jgi:hypothetical protein
VTPTDQTTFGYPGGNCFSACVASLLELPIADVPYFMGDKGTEDWFGPFAEWLKPHGFYPVCFGLQEGNAWRPQGFHILSGKGPRGFDHSVVAREASIVHDPHPSRAGLVTRSDVIMLIPFDPSARKEAP